MPATVNQTAELRGLVYRYLRSRDRRRHLAWGSSLLRFPRIGLEICSTTNYGALHLISRHPPWSITWTWFIALRRGVHRPWNGQARRFGTVPRPAGPLRRGMPLTFNLWLWNLSLHRQDAMPYGPGNPRYNAKKRRQYVHRVANHFAKTAGADAYRAAVVRMNEGIADDD